MQAAIDRVLRSFSFKPASGFDDHAQEDAQRQNAEALADRLLENFKGHLVRNASQRH
jgi:hypothetical protein